MLDITRWREKPKDVEVVQVTEQNYLEVGKWIGAKNSVYAKTNSDPARIEYELIPTGQTFVRFYLVPGDYMVRSSEGILGSLSPTELLDQFFEVAL